MDHAIRPVFLFSLPRSGSTLVQRVLASHPEIATGSEPWLLLPYLHVLEPKGVWAPYDHGLASTAIRHFLDEVPGGAEGYRDAVRDHVLRIYRRAAGPEASYFLDKTPRYGLVASRVVELFPDAKFIFLWRSPLASVASTIQLFGGGDGHLLCYPTTHLDLRDSLAELLATYERNRDRSLGVRYEDLVTEPEGHWPRLFDYLGLRFDPAVLRDFQQVRHRMGDPLGTESYDAIDREPLEKWRAVLGNPYRRAWTRRYLRWIGSERLQLMGYELSALLADLDAAPRSLRRLGRDLGRLALGWLRRQARVRLRPDPLAHLQALRPERG